MPDDEEHVVSASMYCLSPRAVAAIPASTTFDFAAHLTPLLLEQGARVQTYGLRGYWSDVGTRRHCAKPTWPPSGACSPPGRTAAT